MQVRYCLLLEDDGGQTRFWERLQVRNIGDQALHLSIIVELYKAKEELWGSGSYSQELLPEQAPTMGDGGSSQCATLEAPTYYKIIVKGE